MNPVQARAFIDEHQLCKLKRCAEELKSEKVRHSFHELKGSEGRLKNSVPFGVKPTRQMTHAFLS